MWQRAGGGIDGELETGYLFGDDVLIDLALHFLKPSRHGGQLGSAHRLVEDLLAVPFQGEKINKIEFIRGFILTNSVFVFLNK